MDTEAAFWMPPGEEFSLQMIVAHDREGTK